jgi:hypothetical protein
MSDHRLTIGSLLGLVAVSGLWLASLRFATVWWTTAASTVTLALLLSAVLGAFLLRGPDRAFLAGFALFGWVSLPHVNWDWVGAQFGRDLTGGLSDLAEQVLPPVSQPTLVPAANGSRGGAVMLPNPGFIDSAQTRAIKIGNFVRIGRLTLSLLFALLGGLIARALAQRARRERDVRGSGDLVKSR